MLEIEKNATKAEPAESINKATTIKGNAKTREFHLPGCSDYNCTHCTLEFKNIDIALEADFTPCEICNKRLNQQP